MIAHLFSPELVTVVVVDAVFIAAGLVDDMPEYVNVNMLT